MTICLILYSLWEVFYSCMILTLKLRGFSRPQVKDLSNIRFSGGSIWSKCLKYKEKRHFSPFSKREEITKNALF